MKSRRDKFDLKLTDDQREYVVKRAKETGLFHLLTDEFISEMPMHISGQEDVPEETFREILRLMSSRRRQEYDDVLTELGGVKVESGYSHWRIPNLYVVAENDTMYWDMEGVHEETDTDLPVQIYTLHLVDVGYRGPLYELWSMGMVPVTVESDLDEDQIQEMHRIQDKLDYSNDLPGVEYQSGNPLGSDSYVICKHLGAPEFPLFDQDGDPRDIHREYMDEMACQLSGECDVRYDIDVDERLREDAIDRLRAEHVGIIMTVECGKDHPADQLPDWMVRSSDAEGYRREEGVYTTGPWHCNENGKKYSLLYHEMKLVACLDMDQWERLLDEVPMEYSGESAGALGMPSPDGVELGCSPAEVYTLHPIKAYIEAYVTPYPKRREVPSYEQKPYGYDDWAFTREAFIADYNT